MALICPVCSTENRDGAHFCRSCGVALSTSAASVATAERIPPPPSPEREWATTAPAQLRAPTIPAPLFDPGEQPPAPARSFFGRTAAAPRDDEQTVLMVHDDGLPHAPAPRAISPTFESEQAAKADHRKPRARGARPVPADRPPRKRVGLLWLGLLVVAVAMVVAGWYGYGTRKAPAAVEQAASPVVAPVTPPAVAAPVPAAEPPPAPAPVPAPQTSEPVEAPPAADTTAASAVAAPKPVAKPRKQATAAAPAPTAPEPAPAVAAPAAPTPAPAPPAEPQAQCGDRNFIAKAQCMAAQCLKPEFKAHAQCEAVRRQQRLEEEKRNPTLVN
ncbi:zinc-ribbon domain-containing protein [Variovorax sp. RCC_210]